MDILYHTPVIFKNYLTYSGLQKVRTITIQIGRYPVNKINILECVFNNKIYIIFLTKLHEIL